MRQRAVKNLETIIGENQSYAAANPKQQRGHWSEVFPNPDRPLWLEIGSGKGQFAVQTALANPDINFIACEGLDNVYVRILQKAGELQLTNLIVICERIDDVREYFAEGELSRLYLNFCDPWPKARHEKRRLTYGKKLLQYREVLKPGSVLQFKTDNDALFEYSLTQFDELDFEYEFTRDLYGSEFADGNIPTEYEEKFSSQGKNINFARLMIK